MIGRSITSPVLIGRQEELAVLDDARRALAQSQGSMVLVGGEPGIGKTRLIAQFMRSAAEGRLRNLATAECLERAQQPFGPIRTFLQAFEKAASAADLPANVRMAQRQLGSSARPAHEAAGADTISALEKAQLFPALASFFKLVADKRSTIAAIEDIQWADASTLDFLTFLVPQIASMRLMLIATYRSDQVEGNAPLSKALARLVREAHAHHIVLEPLSPGDVRALMTGALGEFALPAKTGRDIEARCDGNPFFTEELLKSALARPASGDAPLPLSIRATIMERLVAFTDDERGVLSHAAVLGYRFDPALLAVVMQRDIDALLPTLRRARDLQILVEEESGERVLCRFRHALTRRTIYEDMLVFNTRALHRKILAMLEAIGDSDRHIEELAYHAWEAKDATRSLTYNERAGDSAFALRALPEAAICFERALEAVTDEGDRARLLTRIGCVAQSQGRLNDGLEPFEAALAIRARRKEYDDAALIVGWIMGDRTHLGDETAVIAAETFLRESGAFLSGPARDGLAALIARLFSARFDFAAVDRLLSQVSHPTSLQPRARQNYVIAQLNRHVHRGDVTAWIQSVDEFDGFSAAVPLINRIVALYTIGQTGTYLGPSAHQRVERSFDKADRLATKWGFDGIAVFGAAVRAEYLWLRGRLAAARECAERVLAAPDFFVARQILVHVAPLLALALGDDTLASRSLGEVRSASAIACETDRESLAARGTWLAVRGRRDEALRDLHLALRDLQVAMPFNATLLTSCARYLDKNDAVRITELLKPADLHPSDRAGHATAAMCASILAERDGDVDLARQYASDAADMYGGQCWPMFEARALEIAGRDAEALDLYERCGALADVCRLSPSEPNKVLSPKTGILSLRENEIAENVTLGLTNTEIAERLSVSPKTIEKHLASIFVKLGIRSRAQIAAFIARENESYRNRRSG